MNGLALRVTHDDWRPTFNVWEPYDDAGSGASSAFGLRDEPNWLEPTMRRFRELLQLGNNWDTQGSAAIPPRIVTAALNFLSDILYRTTAAPQIVPLSNGSLQLEWHENGVDLEIEIFGPTEISVFFEDHDYPERSFENDLSVDYSALQYPVARLTH